MYISSNLADEPSLANGPPSQSRMDALNTTTPNLADGPPSTEHRCLEYHYIKLSRWTPQSINHRCLEYCYTKLGRWPPSQSSINALNTATLNWADGPPTTPLPSHDEEWQFYMSFYS